MELVMHPLGILMWQVMIAKKEYLVPRFMPKI